MLEGDALVVPAESDVTVEVSTTEEEAEPTAETSTTESETTVETEAQPQQTTVQTSKPAASNPTPAAPQPSTPTPSTPSQSTSTSPASASANLQIIQDMENNQILDALAYLGYDIAGAKAAGNLWNVDAEGVQAQYLCSRDTSLYIRYNDGGADGYNKLNGLPNLTRFRSAGLCCASFITYVYFNCFETVAGIDTSALRQSISNHRLYLRGNFASDYYTIGEAWAQDGVAKKLTASVDANGYVTWYDQNGNVTTPAIGTLIIYQNTVEAVRPDGGVNHIGEVHHISIWLGEKDGVQYVAQMGNGTNSTTGLDYGPRIHNLAETVNAGAEMGIRCAYDPT